MNMYVWMDIRSQQVQRRWCTSWPNKRIFLGNEMELHQRRAQIGWCRSVTPRNSALAYHGAKKYRTLSSFNAVVTACLLKLRPSTGSTTTSEFSADGTGTTGFICPLLRNGVQRLQSIEAHKTGLVHSRNDRTGLLNWKCLVAIQFTPIINDWWYFKTVIKHYMQPLEWRLERNNRVASVMLEMTGIQCFIFWIK